MSILGILFSGKERAMIHRAAMAIWEGEHPLGQGILVADVVSLLIKTPDGITTPQGTEKI
jgi:hypothetical protein